MKIGIIGANGKAGNLILKEAVNRGHQVTAIVRDASKLKEKVDAVIEKSIFDLTSDDIKSFDVVVNAFGAPIGEEQAHVDAGRVLMEALKGISTRAIIVGGAGSLFVDENETIRVMDTPDFPDIFIPTAKGKDEIYKICRNHRILRGLFISPSAMFDSEGKRTGFYQAGKDHLLVNSKGESLYQLC